MIKVFLCVWIKIIKENSKRQHWKIFFFPARFYQRNQMEVSHPTLLVFLPRKWKEKEKHKRERWEIINSLNGCENHKRAFFGKWKTITIWNFLFFSFQICMNTWHHCLSTHHFALLRIDHLLIEDHEKPKTWCNGKVFWFEWVTFFRNPV
jgi:hypothetical protein